MEHLCIYMDNIINEDGVVRIHVGDCYMEHPYSYRNNTIMAAQNDDRAALVYMEHPNT
jgi:hypothetical protein